MAIPGWRRSALMVRRQLPWYMSRHENFGEDAVTGRRAVRNGHDNAQEVAVLTSREVVHRQAGGTLR